MHNTNITATATMVKDTHFVLETMLCLLLYDIFI